MAWTASNGRLSRARLANFVTRVCSLLFKSLATAALWWSCPSHEGLDKRIIHHKKLMYIKYSLKSTHNASSTNLTLDYITRTTTEYAGELVYYRESKYFDSDHGLGFSGYIKINLKHKKIVVSTIKCLMLHLTTSRRHQAISNVFLCLECPAK